MHTESGRQRREVIRSGPESLGRDTEKEEDCKGWEILPGEWEVQTTYWAPQAWGPKLGGRVSKPVGLTVGLFETYTSLVKNAHTLTYSRNKKEEADWNCPGLWLVSWDCPGTWPSPSLYPTQLLLLQHGSPLGPRCQRWEGEGDYTLRQWSQLGPTLRASAPATCDSPPAPIGGAVHWAEEKPQLTPGSGSSPSISYQADSCQHPLREDETHAHIRFSSPTSCWAQS